MGKSTINDVARVAGVSKKTVSRVINLSPLLGAATRERVETVIAELGFVPSAQARALALRRNFLVALVHAAGHEHELPEIARGMSEALAGTEFALLLRPLAAGREAMAGDFGRFLDEHRPFAAVLAGTAADAPGLPRLAREAGCRLALLGGERDEHDLADDRAGMRLTADDRAATARAVAWLVSLGHRRIGLIVGPEDSAAARARELGYLDALADSGLDRGAALIANGDDGFESGMADGRLLLEVSPPPSAVIAGSLASAAGVLDAAAGLGLTVPRDLALIAFGDEAGARYLRPRPTTLTLPLAEMARLATRALIDPAAPAPARAFAAELAIRDSTAPPRELELIDPPPLPLPRPQAAAG